MTELTGPWADRAFLRDVQYRTDDNLAARQSIYAYQHPRINLQALVLDLAAPVPGETVADVGCGNGTYLAELTRRGFAGRVLGVDMSLGMLAAARARLRAVIDSADGAGRPRAHQLAGIELVAADATALPLRDRAVDLTLALHMLYHVPDSSQALRELRRVTRPAAGWSSSSTDPTTCASSTPPSPTPEGKKSADSWNASAWTAARRWRARISPR